LIRKFVESLSPAVFWTLLKKRNWKLFQLWPVGFLQIQKLRNFNGKKRFKDPLGERIKLKWQKFYLSKVGDTQILSLANPENLTAPVIWMWFRKARKNLMKIRE